MRADKLFYAVVVLGASITGGCGSSTEPESDDAGALADAGDALDSGGATDAGGPTDAGEEEDGIAAIDRTVRDVVVPGFRHVGIRA